MAISEGLPVTPHSVARVLLEGAILGLVAVALAHALRRYAAHFLFFILLIAALVYVHFAIRADAGSGWIVTEAAGVVMFGVMGWLGLRWSIWWLAAAWALHPVWDLGLHYFGSGSSFVDPLRYPIPCVSFDLVVAGYVAHLTSRLKSVGRWREGGGQVLAAP